jgi:His-Xaa-Ser system radical SAM maturase HxsC
MIALRTKGVAYHISEALMGRVTYLPNPGMDSAIRATEVLPLEMESGAFLATITTAAGTPPPNDQHPLVMNLRSLEHLGEGDLVALYPSGLVTTLFRAGSEHNTLFTTDQCNSNCLMCSQPPKEVDDIEHYFQLNQKLLKLIPADTDILGVTGGEPTLLGDRFFQLIQAAKDDLPQTRLHILTNGRAFAWKDWTRHFQAIDYSNVILGIPLYSDLAPSHDYIVQAHQAFNQTILGLHNLARLQVRIEIRIVLHKLSIERLPQLARFIYRNLPFVEHIAFMGLEYTGYTPHNDTLLWIEPADYMVQLQDAVTYLDDMGLTVSIYNLPLCLLPAALWPFARKSISDWKQAYVPACSACQLLDECGGVFATSKKLSQQIKPFLRSHEVV